MTDAIAIRCRSNRRHLKSITLIYLQSNWQLAYIQPSNQIITCTVLHTYRKLCALYVAALYFASVWELGSLGYIVLHTIYPFGTFTHTHTHTLCAPVFLCFTIKFTTPLQRPILGGGGGLTGEGGVRNNFVNRGSSSSVNSRPLSLCFLQ